MVSPVITANDPARQSPERSTARHDQIRFNRIEQHHAFPRHRKAFAQQGDLL